MIEVVAARHAYHEPAGFFINRERGHENWTFLHFTQPVRMQVANQTILTKPHACMIYQPLFPQHFCAESPLEHDWIHFNMEDEQFLEQCGLKPNQLFYPEQHEFITRLTCEIEVELNNNFRYSSQLLSIKMHELFIKLFRHANGQVPDQIPISLVSGMEALRKKVFLSLDQKHTVQSMSKCVGLSESRFFAVYKLHFGISPIEDLINARLENAKNQLLGTDNKISEIAHSLGYTDVTHFIRQFKSRTGKSPTRYRKS